jgi:hypothetical protein
MLPQFQPRARNDNRLRHLTDPQRGAHMSDPAGTAGPAYEVVSPLGEPVGGGGPGAGASQTGGRIPPAAPLADLAGKRIGLVWSAFKNGNVFLEAMEKLIGARFRDVDFVKLPAGRNLRWGDHPHESMAELAREARLDAAIAAVGG